MISPFIRGIMASSGTSAPADETAPVITSATIVDFGPTTNTALRLTTNEPADEDYVLTMLDFGLETVVEVGEPEIIAVSSPVWLTSTTLRLTTARPILAGEDLYLRVAFDAVRDLAGNPNAITDFYHDAMPPIVNNSTRT